MNRRTDNNKKRRLLHMFIDCIAFLLAFLFSFQFQISNFEFYSFSYELIFLFLLFLAIKLFVFNYLKLYNISLDFISLHDLANIGKGCLISSGILFIIIYGVNINFFQLIPKKLLLVDLFASFLLSSAFKISRRMYFEVVMKNVGHLNLPRTLIIGAGNAGEQLIRAINRNTLHSIYPIGFLDDDPSKQNLIVQGIKVLGTTGEISQMIKTHKIELIIIAVLSADKNFYKRMLKAARDSGINNVKIVSTINDLSDAIQVSVQDIKDIDVCDLIGRQAVSVNTKEINFYLQGKRVLITGAAGSIGSEIARQICLYHPEVIGILDINESDLTTLELELNYSFSKNPVVSFLCDISDYEKVNKIISEFNPEVIFHAAAYKHVPVMEKFPEEAVRVNIIGTYNLTKAAMLNGVNHFVFISTDKAVNPSSIMGVTKRIAEIIVTNAGSNSDNAQFVAVRFGNVLGSRGSVLPIFIEQIKKGGPLTVTHPEMKRYFMTIPESVALVLQAAATGKNSDVFILDMGEPVKIIDLARELILLNNLEPDKDIKIVYTGIREGEKLFEEILTAKEEVDSTQHEKIFKARLSNETVINLDDLISDFRDSKLRSKRDWINLFIKYVPSYSSYENQNLLYLGKQSRRNT